MSLESIHNKRAILVAQREQIMGQFNMTNGAIAMLDELIGEAAAEGGKRLATEAARKAATPMHIMEGRDVGREMPAPSSPEMLPVIHDAPGTGDEPEAAEGRVWPAGDEPWLQDAPVGVPRT